MVDTLDDRVLIGIYQRYQHNLLQCMHEAINHGHYDIFLRINDKYYDIDKKIDLLYNKVKDVKV